jgi:hypothetical protein
MSPAESRNKARWPVPAVSLRVHVGTKGTFSYLYRTLSRCRNTVRFDMSGECIADFWGRAFIEIAKILRAEYMKSCCWKGGLARG